MTTFCDDIGGVGDLLAALAVGDVCALDDDGLCATTAAVERAGRLLDGLRASVAGEIDDRSRRGLGSDGLAMKRGCRSGAHLVERLTRVSQAEAARRVRLGAAVRSGRALSGQQLPPEHPEVARSLKAGELSTDAANVIVRCLDDARATASADDILVAETALVTAALISPADEVGIQARAWREALDPDGAQPRDERLHRKRAFVLGRERDGLTRFSGALEPVGAALLRAAFAEADKPGSTPRFLPEADRLAGTVTSVAEDGAETIEVLDRRTREQRHYDVFSGLLTAGVRASTGAPVSIRSTASVTAVITLANLRAAVGADDIGDGLTGSGLFGSGLFGEGDLGSRPGGIGWIDGVAEPVSAETIRTLVCSSGFAPLLLGDDGEILYYGRTRRLFSPAQLAAMSARDGGCINCGAPPAWCDGHHVVSWSEGGPTDIDNGALLCRPCHTMIHASDFRLRMLDGRPWMLAPPGLDPGQSWRRLRNHRMEALTRLRC